MREALLTLVLLLFVFLFAYAQSIYPLQLLPGLSETEKSSCIYFDHNALVEFIPAGGLQRGYQTKVAEISTITALVGCTPLGNC